MVLNSSKETRILECMLRDYIEQMLLSNLWFSSIHKPSFSGVMWITRNKLDPQKGMDCFHFFKRSFRYENGDKKTKNETIVFKNYRFLMEIVLKNGCFQNYRF